MLSEKQIKEIRSFLEKSENPLFFFDDDPDGLTSYLLLKKKYKKGTGVCIKASPKAEVVYSAAYRKHTPDLVVILDKPFIKQEILDEFNVPVVWIDHHQPIERDGVNYYNPMTSEKPNNKPTSYWAYKVVEENEWVAVVGIIGDWNVPEKEILDKFDYRDMLLKTDSPPELMFDSQYGKLISIFAFTMKGDNHSMDECIAALEKIESPIEILEQTTDNGKLVYGKFDKIDKEYRRLLEESLNQKEEGEDVFVYTYVAEKNSFTGGLSNELLYRLDNDVVIVGREKDGDVRMSIRSKGKDILPVLNKALEHFEGYGGGHAKACGASIKMEDFPRFIEMIKKEYKKE